MPPRTPKPYPYLIEIQYQDDSTQRFRFDSSTSGATIYVDGQEVPPSRSSLDRDTPHHPDWYVAYTHSPKSPGNRRDGKIPHRWRRIWPPDADPSDIPWVDDGWGWDLVSPLGPGGAEPEGPP